MNFSPFLAVCLGFVLLAGCQSPNNTTDTGAVTGVTLSKVALGLPMAGTDTLIATVQPSGATNQKLTWTSSSPGVATVSASGLVTGVTFGSTTITVTTADGAKTATCHVTIGVVSTLAGSGSNDAVDATGTAASFLFPEGLAIDTAGNLYVADAFLIRKVTAAGNVSTLAGTGASGFENATGIAASFSDARSVAVGPSGDLYVADAYNHSIRMVSSDTKVTTYVDFIPNSHPDSVAVDSAGHVFVGSGYYGVGINPSNYLYKFTSPDSYSVLSGPSAPTNVDLLSEPFGIAVDAWGNVYVADSENNRIVKFDSLGGVTVFAGSTTPGAQDGTGAAASFFDPMGLTVDASGNVYVADTGNSKIRKITPSGVVTTVAGSGKPGFAEGAANVAQFSAPTGVVIDSSGFLYVADRNNSRIRKIQ